MIYKVSDFPSLSYSNYLTFNIKCLFEGLKHGAIAPDLWIKGEKDIEALILGYGGTSYLAHFKGDTEEIEAFLKTLSFKRIISDKPFSFTHIKEESNVYKKVVENKALPFPEIPPLSVLYEKLGYGSGSDISLPSFADFAPDISHLLRHGFAFSVCEEYGAALVFTDKEIGILKGISVKSSLRCRGLGSILLSHCLDLCPKGLFAATKLSGDFYLKNGFEKEPYNIYFGELK